MISVFNGDSNPRSMAYTIYNTMAKLPILCDKKKTPTAKYYNEYWYCDGGYDTETTTIKEIYTLYKGKSYKVIDDNNMIYDNKLIHILGDKYERPTHAWVYHVQMMINGFYITFRYIDKAADFLRELTYMMQDNPAKLIIWIANLNFEWSFLKAYLSDIVTDYFAKSPTKPLYITLNDRIVLRECIGLFGNSLADIAEHYTSTKKAIGDLNYNLIRTPLTQITETEQGYMYNDVKILAELSFVALDTYVKNRKKIPLTSTGILRQETRELLKNRLYYIYKDNYKLIPFHDDDDLKKDAFNLFIQWRKYLYQGGYCHSNASLVGQLLSNCIYADITSAYPYQMLTKRFPAGEIIHTPQDQIRDIIHSHKHYIVKICFPSICAKSSHTLISYNKILNISTTYDTVFDNGRLYRGCNVMIWANEIDLKNISLMYNGKYQILDCWHFTKSHKIDKSIRDLISKYYIDKKVLKANHKPYHEQKVKVNSFYGFFATKIYDETVKMIDGDFNFTKNTDFDSSDAFRHMMLNPYIAYWITSYTRSMLINYISKYPDIIAQYDTDSLIFSASVNISQADMLLADIQADNAKTINNNRDMLNNNDLLDLGVWDIDHIDKLKCMGAKRYIYTKGDKTICTIAGLPKHTLNNMFKTQHDIFDYFDSNMLVPIDKSQKLSCAYRRDISPITINVTDYQGNNCDVTYRSYAALFRIPFKMTVNDVFLAHCEKMNHEYFYMSAD